MRTLLAATLVSFAAASAAAQPAAEADARFFRGMIHHHAQAIEMTDLVEARTDRRDLRMLAGRIAVSQADEIAWMTRWLADHGAAAGAGGHDHHGHQPLMPGMLSPEEMAALAAASGAEFDRLFLEGMIKHHEGALVMVDELLAQPGAAQATEVYQVANDIAADQQADIDRMRRLLAAPPPSAQR